MKAELYHYLVERFKAEIERHIEEEIVGRTFTIVHDGQVYNLTIDSYNQTNIDLTATFEVESQWWRRDRKSLSD